MDMKAQNKKILLLFGMPRSGTTWLGKIFDCHPDVLYLHEPDSEFKIQGVPILVTLDDYEKYKSILVKYCSSLVKKCSTRVNGKTPFFDKSYLGGLKYLIFKANLFLAKFFEKFSLPIPIVNPFNNSVNSKEITVAWKSIESCGRLGCLTKTLPACKAIYIIRHPCGQIASVIKGEKHGNFSSKESSSEDYPLFQQLLKTDYAIEHGLTMEKIKQMNSIERLSIRWVLYNEQALNDIDQIKGRGIAIRYEDLCCDPNNQMRQLYTFAGLSWNTQTEKFLKSSTQGGDAYFGVKRNPKEAMEKWKNELSIDEIRLIKKIVVESKAGQLFKDNF